MQAVRGAAERHARNGLRIRESASLRRLRAPPSPAPAAPRRASRVRWPCTAAVLRRTTHVFPDLTTVIQVSIPPCMIFPALPPTRAGGRRRAARGRAAERGRGLSMRDAARARGGSGKGGEETSRRTARIAPRPRPQRKSRSRAQAVMPRGPFRRRPTARLGPRSLSRASLRSKGARGENRSRIRGAQRARTACGMGSRGDASDGGSGPAERAAPARPLARGVRERPRIREQIAPEPTAHGAHRGRKRRCARARSQAVAPGARDVVDSSA